MFRIPSFYQMNISYDEAVFVLGKNRVLEAMENLNEHWDRHVVSGDDDDLFFELWESEVNAFNVIFSAMKPLFVKETV